MAPDPIPQLDLTHEVHQKPGPLRHPVAVVVVVLLCAALAAYLGTRPSPAKAPPGPPPPCSSATR